MANNVVCAVDVGANKVVAIIARAEDERTLNVLGVGVETNSGFREGMVTDLAKARKTVSEAVRKAEHAAEGNEKTKIKIEAAYIGITGRNISSVNTKSAISIGRAGVSAKDMEQIADSAMAATTNAKQKAFQVLPISYTLNGKEVKTPAGMRGSRLEIRNRVICADATSVQNLLACFPKGIKVEPVLSSLASAEAVLRPGEKETGVLMADIGAGTTDIAVFKAGQLVKTSVLPFGGQQIAQALATGLNIPFETAEEVLRKYGTLMEEQKPAVVVEKEEVDIPSFLRRPLTLRRDQPTQKVDVPPRITISREPAIDRASVGLGNGPAILNRDVNNIIRAKVGEIMRMISKEAPATLIPAGIVLTGGVVNLPGIDSVAHEISNLSVRIGIPKDVYGLADILYDPSYSTAVGLLLWGAKQQLAGKEASNAISPRSPSPSAIKWLRRAIYFGGAAGLGWALAWIPIQMTEHKIGVLKARIAELEAALAAPPPVVAPPPPLPPPTPPTILIIGIILAIVVIGCVTYYLRRKRSQ